MVRRRRVRVWWWGWLAFVLLGALMSGCQAAPNPAAATATTEAQLATLLAEVYAAFTATAQPSPTASPSATATPTVRATAPRGATPPAATPTRTGPATARVTATATTTALAPASPTASPPGPGPTATQGPSATPWPTATRRPPTATAVRPSPTSAAPTATPARPPATATPRPPTATLVPPTATTVPPTPTPVPPTATTAPPTATPVPPSPTPATCAPSANAGYESQVVALINQERQARGLPALAVNGALQAATRAHSTDMICNDFFSHTGSDGSQPWDRASRYGYSWTWIAENLFMGTGISPSTVVQGWMNSSGHRANILASEAVHIGVGYMYDPAEGAWYVTALFGRP